MQQYELEQSRYIDHLENPPYFDKTRCLDHYGGILQNAVHLLKYQKRLAYADGLDNAWNQFMASSLANPNASHLMPAPLSKEKLCICAFNQSREIARRLACQQHAQKLPDALLHRHHKQQQAAGQERGSGTGNSRSVYLDPQHLTRVEHQPAFLFEDVMITGTTLNEIARVLKDNGVSRVSNWAVLRTPEPK